MRVCMERDKWEKGVFWKTEIKFQPAACGERQEIGAEGQALGGGGGGRAHSKSRKTSAREVA